MTITFLRELNYEQRRIVKKKNYFMVRNFFLKVQSTRFYQSGRVKPGIFYEDEKRSAISKHECIRCTGYKNSIPMCFNINKWLIIIIIIIITKTIKTTATATTTIIDK